MQIDGELVDLEVFEWKIEQRVCEEFCKACME